MDPQLKELAQLGTDLQKGLKDLQTAQEKAKTDHSELVKSEISSLADDIADKLAAIQEKQGLLETTIQRVGEEAPAKGQDKVELAKKEAFLAFLRAGGDASKLTVEQQKAMSTDNLGNGGYLVAPQMIGMVNARVFETSAMRKLATVVKTSHKSIEVILDDDEAGGGWAGEGDSVSDTSTPQIGKLEIPAKKLYAYPKVTNEMLADSEYDVEAWLVGKLSDKFARLENTGFVNGNGVSQPRGFLTYAPWAAPGVYERGKIEQIANGSTSAPTESGLIELMGSLKEAYQAGATLVMKRSTFIAYLKLSGTNVFRFFNLQPQSGPQGSVLGSTLTLLEKPVVLFDDMPAVGANALSVAYGNFGLAYTVVDRQAVSVLRDPYTSPGITKFYAEKRVGGGVTNFDAIKLLKMA
jgi:HK97 family phage major capsid protein